MECCEKCKFLYPLKKFVNGDWEYSHVCLLFPFTEEKDEICYAMVIEHPEVQMCEMFCDEKRQSFFAELERKGVFDAYLERMANDSGVGEPIPHWRGNMKGLEPYQGKVEE